MLGGGNALHWQSPPANLRSQQGLTSRLEGALFPPTRQQFQNYRWKKLTLVISSGEQGTVVASVIINLKLTPGHQAMYPGNCAGLIVPVQCAEPS
ncbi:MAG: hypothetical protein DMG89_24325 [Acidobacteria bacterium]|nr:MAG: hypothetical protein DMG89_24325 [Acidobacteriota bacterium]